MMSDNLSAALGRLYSRRTFGVKLGLDLMQCLLRRMGNPEQALACIHVAGTNGKGSVCAILEAVLKTAGWQPGMYTSPHLVAFNERLRIDGNPISDHDLAEIITFVDAHAQGTQEECNGREVTFFEFATAMAFEHFRRRQARLVIIETGLGGRLDATNIITPLLSVITRIDQDHEQYLGPHLAQIAAEKCGIIKPGRPVVFGAMPDEAQEVVRSTARKRGARYIDAPALVSVETIVRDMDGQKIRVQSAATSYGTCRFPLLGHHQAENLATAVATLEEVAALTSVEIETEAVKAGLAAIDWPARFQVLSSDPPTILDGAHNAGGAAALADTWNDLLKKRPMGLILARGGDRTGTDFLKALGGLVERCWCVPIQDADHVDAGDLAQTARSLGWQAESTPLSQALTEARDWARANGGGVCITGSLYLAGEVLKTR